MSDIYIPRADSLPDKVCRYFVRLPNEELLSRQVAANYDVSVSNVGVNLKLAVEAGYLTVDGSVYSAGPNLNKFEAAIQSGAKAATSSGFHRWLERNGESSAEGRAQRRGNSDAGTPPPAQGDATPRRLSKAFRLDLSSIAIEKDVPLPAGKVPAMDWPALLGRLEVGDSFLLPSEARSAIGSAATKFKKATSRVLSIRVVPEGVRVWRTE
ncbi:hypothetical protein [Hydrogenophaga taeniospiralis]|uniref:hypothetical protein n=1 Tax=Hydrogenophaga taeniospiralis TaxID=65656 RepID=UPI001CF96C55|nr:hypothetical protein [Hydrogenophaga taeniospiralis]UCU92663.1 hypothetical protein KI616_17740 [Hydrogenophaga taeniospiralis]